LSYSDDSDADTASRRLSVASNHGGMCTNGSARDRPSTDSLTDF